MSNVANPNSLDAILPLRTISVKGNPQPFAAALDLSGDGLSTSTETDPTTGMQTLKAAFTATKASAVVASTSSSVEAGQAIMSNNGLAQLANSASLGLGLTHAGIAAAAGVVGASITVITQGLVDPSLVNLGAGLACAVGTNAAGDPVRITDAACVSGKKIVGVCDVNGAIYVAPRLASKLNVFDFGAKADSDGMGAGTDLGPALTAMIAFAGAYIGDEIKIPRGNYRISTPVVVSRCITIRGAGGGVFYAPTQLFADSGVSAFIGPYIGGGSTSKFEDFWIGAVAKASANTTGAWTSATRQLIVSAIDDFAIGDVVCLGGVGGQTRIPYLMGTVTSGDDKITLSNLNGYGVKAGHFITMGTAYPLATQIVSIDETIPSAWVLTMASNAAATETNPTQVSYCFDLIARITGIAGTTVTLDSQGSVNGSGAIPATASGVPLTHADTAFYMQMSFITRDVYVGASGLGFAGAAFTLCGETDDVPAGNADLGQIQGGYCYGNRHAIYVRGDAANVNRFISIGAVQSTDWSFRDGSEIGNVYLGCHSDGGYGFVTLQSAANASTFVHCYCEGGTMQALGDGCTWIGGVGAVDPGGTSMVGGRTNKSYHVSADGTASLYTAITDFGNSTNDYLEIFTPGNATYPYVVRHTNASVEGFTGWWGVASSEGTRSYAMLFPEIGSADYISGAPPVWFPGGIWVGGPNATVAARTRITSLDTAPASGTWAVGDFVFNNTPSELGISTSKYVILGWTCVAAGTPGTWLQARTLTGN